MGQVPHDSALTTSVVWHLIQQSPESLQSVTTRHGVNPKTVATWRSRTTTIDAPMGSKPAPTALMAAEGAVAVACCQHTQLPLDAVAPLGLFAVQLAATALAYHGYVSSGQSDTGENYSPACVLRTVLFVSFRSHQ